jgi:uncharacterized membrane protein SpoIIM required for sporulation
MREAAFLKLNSPKWSKYESLIASPKNSSPDDLADLYIELTDDLSYARTNYPGSQTELYLNSLTSKTHGFIYKSKKEKKSRFVSFWKTELPCLFKKYHKNFLYSFIIFFLASCIGAISAAYDDTFVRLILGDNYVNMTLKNIASGDPLAIYKGDEEINMFLGITINNIKVSIFTFAFGILCSVGTGYFLFSNGVMLGAFQYFFYSKGLLLSSVLIIWIHGTLEISAIIIAGAAGIIMGNSILFPGTYSRLDSFRRGAMDGMKITIGLVPIFIVAGFLESFVTRYTDMPVLIKILIITVSATFIIYYFLIYPTFTTHRKNVTENRIP